MKKLLAAVAVMVAAGIGPASGEAPTCRYQGAVGRGSGMVYLSTAMTVSRNGRCSHAVSGTAGNVRIVTPPRHGRVESTSGSLTYTPERGFVGSDVYVFAGSHSGGRAEVTVNVTVTE